MPQNYYRQIKTALVNNEAYKRVKDYSKNRSDLATYYNVGKILIIAQGGEKRAKYGDELIKTYSKRLIEEVGKQYNWITLTKMRKFYLMAQKVATVSQQLTWSHYVELLKFDDIDEVNYYISLCESQALSVRELRQRIKSRDYERLSLTAKKKLAVGNTPALQDIVKDPIIIKSNYTNSSDVIFSEKVLRQLILEDLPHFLKELGEGFTFIDQEYKIRTANNYNYIDLLLFNYKYNCFVVIELKVTELRAEHIGQIKKYMNYIDGNLKTITQDKTIGIIITKKNNKFVIEYCSDPRVKMVEWRLG